MTAVVLPLNMGHLWFWRTLSMSLRCSCIHTQAAAAAYLKDLEGGDPADARPPLPSDGTATTPSLALHPALAESFEFRKAKAHAEILTAIQERETKAEREVATMAPPPPPSQWQQAVTPEGQLYYYNIFTRGTLSYITLNLTLTLKQNYIMYTQCTVYSSSIINFAGGVTIHK